MSGFGIQVTDHFTFFLQLALCVHLVVQLETLKGTYELYNLLILLASAHFSRFVQLFMEGTIRFHDLLLTVAVGGFYITFHLFSKSSVVVLCVAFNLLVLVLMFMSKLMEPVEPDSSPIEQQSYGYSTFSQGEEIHYYSFEDGRFLHSRIGESYDHAIKTQGADSQWETKDPFDIRVTEQFVIIVLSGLCVDLVDKVEKLKGTFELYYVFILLTIVHTSRFMQLRIPSIFYLRKVLLIYDFPITAAIAAFYITSHTYSDALAKKLRLGIYALFFAIICFHKLYKKRSQYMPSQEYTAQQNYVASHSLSFHSNFSQRQIWDPPIEESGFASVHHVASNRVSGDLCAVVKEEIKDDNANENDDSVFAKENDDAVSETTNYNGWEKGESVGGGSYGTVYVAHNRESRELCAVKELKNIHKLVNVESIRKEITLLSQLEHPNIVKYYGHNIVGRHFSLYMELVLPGSLKKYILERVSLHEPLIRNFTVQILSGLVYLHSKRVVHRDLKPDNLLVNSENIVKLVDFGLAKHLAESVGKHSEWGTPYYAAPEVLKKKEYKSSREASAADIWSLGCVIIEMFSGSHPWPGFEPVQVMYRVHSKRQHPPIPEEICREGKDFLKLCFTRNPANRPSAGALLVHPFVNVQL